MEGSGQLIAEQPALVPLNTAPLICSTEIRIKKNELNISLLSNMSMFVKSSNIKPAAYQKLNHVADLKSNNF